MRSPPDFMWRRTRNFGRIPKAVFQDFKLHWRTSACFVNRPTLDCQAKRFENCRTARSLSPIVEQVLPLSRSYQTQALRVLRSVVCRGCRTEKEERKAGKAFFNWNVIGILESLTNKLPSSRRLGTSQTWPKEQSTRCETWRASLVFQLQRSPLLLTSQLLSAPSVKSGS